jgi:hypothetical protein
VADAVLLDGLRAELLAPDTIRYVTEALARAMNHQIDERPRLLSDTVVKIRFWNKLKELLCKHLGLLEQPDPDDDRPAVPVFLLPPGSRVETKLPAARAETK